MNDKIHDIIKTFCVSQNQDISDVVGDISLKPVCVTRYMIYAYLHNVMNIPASQIASIFNRSRINVFRGIRVLKGWMRFHEDIHEKYLSIVKVIEGDS